MVLLSNGSFLASYYIFIRDGFKIREEELLERLGLLEYKLLDNEWKRNPKILLRKRKKHIFLAEVENWKHLMDDFTYSLRFNPDFENKLNALSKSFDIFCCSIGDIDESFDFKYFENGALKREYIVEDPKFNGGEITKNFGQPLGNETVALEKKDLQDKVLSIAKLIGINTNHQLEKISCYSKTIKETELFMFNENEY